MAEFRHPAIPMRRDPATGGLATVEHDSLAEVRQCAFAVLRTRPGQRIENPDLGLPLTLHGPRLDPNQIQVTLERWEPRAGWTLRADDRNLAQGLVVTHVRQD